MLIRCAKFLFFKLNFIRFLETVFSPYAIVLEADDIHFLKEGKYEDYYF